MFLNSSTGLEIGSGHQVISSLEFSEVFSLFQEVFHKNFASRLGCLKRNLCKPVTELHGKGGIQTHTISSPYFRQKKRRPTFKTGRPRETRFVSSTCRHHHQEASLALSSSPEFPKPKLR